MANSKLIKNLQSIVKEQISASRRHPLQKF